MKHLFRNFLIIFLATAWTGSFIHAQGMQLEAGIFQHKVKLGFGEGKSDSISYMEVRDSTAFRTLVDLIEVRHFPVCVVKKPIVGPFINLLQNYEVQLEGYKMLEQQYKSMDTIQNNKLHQMGQLVVLEKERTENYRTLSNDMCNTNKELSTQLGQALQVAKSCNNGKVRKQWLVGILGGAVGFSVATLIALVK